MSESCSNYCDVYEVRFRIARRPYQCCACATPIGVGDHYAYVFTLFEGSVRTYRRCGSCELIHAHLVVMCEEQTEEMWPREDLGCVLKYQDEWGELPDDIAALAFTPPAERGQLLKRTAPVRHECTEPQ